MEIEVGPDLVRQYLESLGYPSNITVTDLPDAATIRKMRQAGKTITRKFREWVQTVPLNVLGDTSKEYLVYTKGKFEVLDYYQLNGYGGPRNTQPGVMVTTLDSALGAQSGYLPVEWAIEKVKSELTFPPRVNLEADGYNSSIRWGMLKVVFKGITTPSARDAICDPVHAATSYSHSDMVSINNYNAGQRVTRGDLRNLTNFIRNIDFDGQFLSRYRNAYFGSKRENQVVPVVRHDTSANLEAFLNKRKYDGFTSEERNRDNIDTLPVANHGVLSSRTWGIEVESGGRRGVYAPDGWDDKYDGSLRSAYSGGWIDASDCENDHNEELWDSNDGWVTNDDYWGESYDCDLCEQDSDNEDDTGEFVSPILRSFHSRGLEKLVGELSEEPQNDSAGVHVHVGAEDLTAKQIGGLVFAYEMIEPLIETSYRREERGYCKNRTTKSTMAILKAAKTVKYKSYQDAVKDGHSGADYIPFGDRYVSLNLLALEDHGTVEFRAMGPVYEYEHLIKWAHFCREMVNLAKKDVPAKEWSAVRNFADVRALFAKYGEETSDAIFQSIADLEESSVKDAELAEV